jgi:hypothetical protein
VASALVLSAIGVLGTLSGSGLTALVAARSERRKDAALERLQIRQEQAQDRSQVRELRAEHQKWRRDRRQAAYQAFLDAMNAARWSVVEYGGVAQASSLVDVDVQRKKEAADKLVRTGEHACNTIRLEGPDNVSSAAVAYWSSVVAYSNLVTKQLHAGDEAGRGDDLGGQMSKISTTEKKFIREACAALDELLLPG